MSDDPFLSRWSRLKHEARQSPQPPAVPVPAPVADAAAAPPTPEPQEPAPLPPLESLTPESDFTPFMRSEVDPATRRQALKTLFQDPQFNVMDGLDTYIADYSQPDPLPEGWLEKMTQVARLGDVFAMQEREKAAAEALAARAAEENPAAGVNPPAAPDVPSGEATEQADPVDPIEEMPTRTA